MKQFSKPFHLFKYYKEILSNWILINLYLFRSNEKWLSYEVYSVLKLKYSELYGKKWISFIKHTKEYTFDRNRWWLILMIIIFVFCIGLLTNNLGISIISLDADSAKALIDHRAANIAVIISITLVVVGFLITTIALKESLGYRILFDHSRLYPIVYTTLGTIGCMFIISTLRDSIHPNYFKDLVITGTILAISILFLIGFLFRTIVLFTDEKTIWSHLRKELLDEGRYNITLILSEKYSIQAFKALLEKYNGSEYNWVQEFENVSPDLDDDISDEEVIPLEDKTIIDINIQKIEQFIESKKKKSTSDLMYNPLSLNTITSNYENYLWFEDLENDKNDKKILRDSLLLSRPGSKKTLKKSILNYFNSKLEDYGNKSDYQNMERLLEIYLELFELQMKYR